MEVTARAPGKIILAGEHAVVHGSTAVAASINLYTYVTIRIPPASECDGLLKLHLKGSDLDFSWPIDRIKEAVADFGNHTPLKPKSCPSECQKDLASLVKQHKIPEAKAPLVAGVTAFLWLYTSIHGFKSGSVIVSSELPTGSGLGSSASLCVSLTGALLGLTDYVGPDRSKNDWLAFDESKLDLVNKWAFEGEKIIHGKPSGLDNTVSTYGNMIKFRSGQLTCIKSSTPLKMMITDTKVEKDTKALVARVSKRTMRHPDAMASVFSAVDSISKDMSELIQSPVTDETSLTEKEEKLGEMMEMNQGLLQCMGVSHSSIDTILRTAMKFKLVSKLTGAGGGGCVLTLLPTKVGILHSFESRVGISRVGGLISHNLSVSRDRVLSSAVVDKVMAELETCGFQCFTAAIGGNGVEVCFGSRSS